MFPHCFQSVRQRATGVPDRKIDWLEISRVPARLVADLRWVEHPGLYSEKGHIAWREGPFGQKLDCLRARESVKEAALPGSRAKERVDLEGHHWPGV